MLILLLSLLFFFTPTPAHAVYDPASLTNNKFGMHIADFNDIADVATLVNSNGGDWGYVTLVLTDNDRDSGKWQRMFDQMRRLHLIPLVRIATHVSGESWVKPVPDTFDELVKLLNSLNWPVKNRYVILYNEPNHANEWGGNLDPEGYADVLVTLGKKLKAASDDFFILPAGLDVSAASDHYSMSASDYLARMIRARPDIADAIDGWTSHSYPNPGFSGSPYARGRGTLTSYIWELSYLRSLNVSKKLPVFITETGWEHNQGKTPHYGGLTPETVASNIQIAVSDVWGDSQIVAVTPFVFNYQDVPFDGFSWKRYGSGEYYPFYSVYKSVKKEQGNPPQEEIYLFADSLFPSTLVANSSYSLSSTILNRGQGIYNEQNGYEVVFEADKKGFVFFADAMPTMEPDQSALLTAHIKTPAEPGTYRMRTYIAHNGEKILVDTADIHIVPPPSVTISVQFGWRSINNQNDITALVYDGVTLLHKITGLEARLGVVKVPGLNNIIPDKKYRIVLLAEYYLPRQTIAQLSSGETAIPMKRFYPVDFDANGTFDGKDLFALIAKRPHNIMSLFMGP